MATLTWNGSTQYTEFGTLTGGLETVTVGDHTLVALVKVSAWANFHDPFAIVNAARTTTYAGAKLTNINALAYDSTRFGADDGVNHGTSTTTWYMAATTMAVSDTPDVVCHWRDHTANGAWVHANGTSPGPGNAPAATPGAGGFIQHGRWQSSDFFHGNIAVAAVWAGRLTNAQLDELKANDRTSDWWNCSFGRPKHLVEFNVAETALVDLTGNSVRVAPAAAPTLAGGDPDRWTFDGTGTAAVAAPASLDPQIQWTDDFGPGDDYGPNQFLDDSQFATGAPVSTSTSTARLLASTGVGV